MDVHGVRILRTPWLFAVLFGLFRRLLEIPEALHVTGWLRQVHACTGYQVALKYHNSQPIARKTHFIMPGYGR